MALQLSFGEATATGPRTVITRKPSRPEGRVVVSAASDAARASPPANAAAPATAAAPRSSARRDVSAPDLVLACSAIGKRSRVDSNHRPAD